MFAVGPFDPQWLQNEDGDWMVRLCLGGHHLTWLQKMVYAYRQQGQGISTRRLKEQLECQYRYWPDFIHGPHRPSYLDGREDIFLYYKFIHLIPRALQQGLDEYAWKILAIIKPQTQFNDLPLRSLMTLCLEFAYCFNTPEVQAKIIPYLCQQVGLSPQMRLKPSPLSLEGLVMWWMGPWAALIGGEEVRFGPAEQAYLELSLLIYPTLFYPQPNAALDLLAKLEGGGKSGLANFVLWRALYSRQWGLIPRLLPRLQWRHLGRSLGFSLRFRFTLKKWMA
jgi:hypothetical protein